MSTLRVNTLQDTAGVERYTARAWVNFNGTGTVAIRASGNVSSITDNGTGDYTVNFTTAMPDANYCVQPQCNWPIGDFACRIRGVVPTTSSLRLRCEDGSGNLRDSLSGGFIDVAIFR